MIYGPADGYGVRRMVWPDTFGDLVQEVFDELPEQFKLENCPILVEKDEAKRTPSGDYVAGEFLGCSHIRKNGWHACETPKRIILYKRVIEAMRPDLEIKARVRFVLVHEIGHALGLNEQEVVAALGDP